MDGENRISNLGLGLVFAIVAATFAFLMQPRHHDYRSGYESSYSHTYSEEGYYVDYEDK